VKFTERKQWLYDPALFTRLDTQTALKLHSEYVRRSSPVPPPQFFEVDVSSAKVDDLWHFPLDNRTMFRRTLDMPAIVRIQKPDWRLTKIGLVPQQKTTFWLGNLILEEFDYFPTRGDMIYYNGYRQMIVSVNLAPEAYWQQTNVWLGMTVDAIIPAEGDARPLLNPGVAAVSEVKQTRPLPEA
jgi:hypothetical protein